jgi:hypothetical protein
MDDIKSLVTRFYDTWNEHDRDGCSQGAAKTLPSTAREDGLVRASTPTACSGVFGRML